MATTIPGKYNLAFNPSIWSRCNGEKIPSSYPAAITMSELWESGGIGMAVARGGWAGDMSRDGIGSPWRLKVISGWHVGRLLEHDWTQEIELIEMQATQLAKSGAQIIVYEESAFNDILVWSEAAGAKLSAELVSLKEYGVRLSHFCQYLQENYGLRSAFFLGTLSAQQTIRAMYRLIDLAAPSVGFAIDADCLGNLKPASGVVQPVQQDRIAHMLTSRMCGGIESSGQDKVFSQRFQTALYFAGIYGDSIPFAVPRMLNAFRRSPYQGWVVDQAVMVG